MLGKDKWEELHLDGSQLTGRAVNESLPVAGSLLRVDGSADPGNFLVPPGQKLEGYAKNLTGSTDGEIALPTEPIALLQKHDLLDERISLLELATLPPQAAGGGWSKGIASGSGRVFFYGIDKIGEQWV